MKLKILLIDDEELTTMAIARILSRYPDSYEVAGTALNGREGLKLLETIQADVVIADIRMPILDGIGFLKELKEKQISVYSIILSAYRDFDYAQQALRYGANDYLLKPLSREKLLAALNTAAEKLTESRLLIRESSQNLLRKQQQALHTYLKKRIKTDYYKPSWELRITGPYQLMLMRCPEELPFNFMDDCRSLGWVPCTSESMVFQADPNTSPDILDSLIKETLTFSGEYFLPYLVFCLSNTRNTWDELPDAYQECLKTADYYFYLSDLEYIPYSMISKIRPLPINSLSPHFERLQEYLKLGSEEATFNQLDHIYAMLARDKNAVPAVVIQLFYDFLLMALDTLQAANSDSGITDYVKNIILQKVQSFPTLNLLYQYINIQLSHYFNHTETMYLQSNDRIVARVKDFCERNYNQDCSLDDIANSVYISKNYLASVFKEKTGISLWNYFTDLRIEKAKELLASGEVTAALAAEKVGYKNASHFGRVFKERTGLTPREYQQKKLQ
ncbi:MAG: response regulator [Oliverpabstia sp.]